MTPLLAGAVSTEPPVVERGGGNHPLELRHDADVVLEGTAEQLYLALWNRSDEVQADGYDLWRSYGQRHLGLR